ncbi:head maturation protease, ClpP-related [Candidatus Enterococcus murrayae]|uniref:ATP-dependent Clp protease proteolytic subunit n=1 Tax=Candidatus Enterococcus murrayae TaxID=2815321 RepID=A0ABS3HBB4_9ENTE|nr:head maturation protease, ClpP-related [Enterococcus sp. MJM16]MBO0450761.1 Clp protease ClpP [Enterococcus sp. MJM16]
MKTILAVKNENTDKPSIHIQGFIGSSWFFEGNTDKGIKNILDSLGDKEEIDVVINSNGGDVFQGIAIGNLLKANKAKINIIINGLAASAASIIAMAGDSIKIFPNAQLMIHRASTWAEGNVDVFRQTADQLESIDKSVKASYKNRFNGSDEELDELLIAEKFMDAESALNYGLVDEIIDEIQVDPLEDGDDEEDIDAVLNQVSEEREKKMAAFTAAIEKAFG